MSKRCLIAILLIILTVWTPLKGSEAIDGYELSPRKARIYSVTATLVPMAVGLGLVAADPNGESGIGNIGALMFWAEAHLGRAPAISTLIIPGDSGGER